MKIIGLLIIAFSVSSAAVTQPLQPNDSIKPFVNYLIHMPYLTAKEYVLKSFEDKDIIIFSERLHPEFTQYEMIVDIIRDNRFKGNVYTEVGSFNSGKQINEFLGKEGLSKEKVQEEILKIFKDLDFFPLWDNYNYYYLIKSIYEINQQRSVDDKIFLYPLNLIFEWGSIKCNEQYSMFMDMFEKQNDYPAVIDYDAIMGKHFIYAYLDAKYQHPNKKKALVIINTYHGYTRIPEYLPCPTEPFTISTAEYIYKTFPKITKGILINFYPTSSTIKLVADGKWDAAFKITSNKDVGFDLQGTPFGETTFDMYNFGGKSFKTVNFEDLFDGFIFYNPIENFEVAVGIPEIFNDSLQNPVILTT
ncbi:MAG: hypothetical protein ABSD71_11000 [Bacteroidales bacterium]|jgi:hypothetical protein